MNTYAFTYQKTYKIKKQVLVALVIFAAAITGLLIGNNLLQEHQAQASSAYEEIVYYKSIEVKYGDT